MATITELLQADVDRKLTTNAIMQIISLLQDLQMVAGRVDAEIDAIVAAGDFDNLHQDLKVEGQACRGW